MSLTTAASAQLTTADILGTVTDTSGAVVPNATLTLTDLATNQIRTVQSNGTGEYIFPLLPVGHYSILVKAAGFEASKTADLSVEAGDRARADIQLHVGAATDVVEVTATTPLLQADSATVSSSVTEESVQDLPVNNRNFVNLVQIVPGANEGPGNGLTSGGRPDDRRQTASFAVNGQDDTLNNYTIDGIDDNERIIGTIGVRPVVEAINEITVQTNNYTAEVGRTAGGVVSVITQEGGNQFHGQVYEFFRNDIFDARNVLQTTGDKPELRQNQFGGGIGGPIFKNRTFFFGDYEGFRFVSGLTYTKETLTQDEYNDVNSLNGGSPQLLLANGNGTQNQAVDPIALAYLKLYPAPNAGPLDSLSNNHVISPNKTQFSNNFDVRVDHKFSDRDLFFGRYDYNHVNTFTPAGFGTDAATGLQISGGQFDFDGPATDVAQQYGYGYTHTFTQNLIADFRAAYTRINNLSLPLNSGVSGGADSVVAGSNGTFAANLNSQSNNLTPIGFPGVGDIGDGSFVPLQDIDGSYQYLGTVSYTKGRHNIKFGASLIRREARNVQSPYVAGQYTFGLVTDSSRPAGSPPGTPLSAVQQRDNGIASALTGAFSGEQRQVDITPPDYRTWEPSGFVQDSWKVTPRLTVLYGIRYDVYTPFTEAHGRIANFDFAEALGLSPSTVGSALKIANVGGVDGHAGISTDHSNVAPRVGFAWSVRPTTVIRGGFGLSYFPGNYTSNTDLKNVPFLSNFQPSCQSAEAIAIEANYEQAAGNAGQTVGNGQCAPAYAQFDQGLPLPTVPDVSNLQTLNPLSFNTESSNFKSGAIDQYNLQVEQQFGANVLSVGYVGNVAHHLPQVINDINQPSPYSTNPNNANYNPGPGPGPRANSGPRQLDSQFPNLNLSGVGLVESEGVSNYNGLQVSYQRRLSQGLAFDANYTWAKDLGDVTGYSQEGSQEGFSDADPFLLRQIEYGPAENDIRNRFALSLNYTFQYGKSWTGISKEALTGWGVSTITVWQSGKPFTILNNGGNSAPVSDTTTYTFNNQTVTESYGDRAVPNNGGGRDRPDQIASPRGNKSNSQFFNVLAFHPQPTGQIGTTARNSLNGPDYRHVDLSVFKNFKLTEATNLQFRAESYNISNTPNFIFPLGDGSTEVGSSNFGRVVNYDPNYVPRQYQFALKVQF
ncbi:MAG TPA: carboxypeptidase-like regulatory domain-containing protein [Terracidiphilus sp.]|nr:carboxypeptidase-like regulatory domain-containing protein [Terracidiphilus sp.]